MSAPAYLLLADGTIFEGTAFGARGETTGEIVFTTGMTGYVETLTDPSYHGQIVLQTFPLIGNYGIIPADFESGLVGASAYIIKHPCQAPSNFRSEGTLDTFLRERGVVGLCGIDTRALTRIIREKGVMNGRITTTRPDPAACAAIAAYRADNPVAAVSSRAPALCRAAQRRFTVALLDFGVKENMKRELLARGCDVWVLPHDSPPEAVLRTAPDGILLSNGPGDPADNTQVIAHLQALMGAGIPTFGICLGHQLLALAHGFATCKLKYGHRGANQPVKHQEDGRVYITSQNHGYAVVSQSIDPRVADEWFTNVNDGTCEGVRYSTAPACSVQFHPEACGGPRDTGFLFDRFIQSMEVHAHAAR